MGYLTAYRGDYLRGYRGDPGLFGSIFKFGRKLIGRAAGAAVSMSPVGAVAKTIVRGLPPGRPTGLPLPGGIRVHPTAIAPGGSPFVTRGGPQPVQNGQCPAGYHPNKQDGKYGPKGTYCVRNRRMNPGNMRAGRKAGRRIASASKHLRTFIRLEKKVKKTRRRR